MGSEMCIRDSAESVYRYEEKGEVIYQDRAPSSNQDNGHSILNKQGVVLKQVLSREERREARKKAEETRLSKIRDRALLATFTTEDDLIRTRDDRMGMIDGLISRLDVCRAAQYPAEYRECVVIDRFQSR